jgi:hypothetical protein
MFDEYFGIFKHRNLASNFLHDKTILATDPLKSLRLVMNVDTFCCL